MAEKLTLEQLRRSAGLEVHTLAEEAGVSTRFVREAEDRQIPMARNKVLQVLEVLSKYHGRPIGIADVKDLKVV
jgi:hypothetical protein